MQSSVIVVLQILPQPAINHLNIIRQPIQALFLKCSVKSLNVSIVIRLAYTSVSVFLFNL